MDKSDFCQYIGLVREIDRLERERERLMAMIQATPQPDGQPRAKYKRSDPVANAAIKLTIIAGMINKNLDKLIDARIKIDLVLGKLPPSDRYLMGLRYKDGLTWPMITERIYGNRGDFLDREESYRRNITRQHGRILDKLKKCP